MAKHLPDLAFCFGGRAVVRGLVLKWGVPLHRGAEPVIFCAGCIFPLAPVPIIVDGSVAAEANDVRLAANGIGLGFEAALADTPGGAKLVHAAASGYRVSPIYAALSSRAHETAGMLCEVVDKAHLIAISLDASPLGFRCEIMSCRSRDLEHDMKSGRFDGSIETGHIEVAKLKQRLGIET